MKHILPIFSILFFPLSLLAQYPKNKDSVWVRENRIQSIVFYEKDRTLHYTFDRSGHLLKELFTDSMNNELESTCFGEFEHTKERHFGFHTIQQDKYDSLHRIESEYYWVRHKPDPPTETGEVDSVVISYRYVDGVRIKNYKGYERTYYHPETTMVHEYNERTYFTSTGADSLIVSTYPYTSPPGDTSSIVQFQYFEGKLASSEYYSDKWRGQYEIPFSPFLYCSQQYEYYPGGALKTRIYSEFSRAGEIENTVEVYTYTEDGYISNRNYTYFDEEQDQMYTSKHAYTEEEIYRETFCYRIEASRENNECVEITYYY
jgi:hypothetical protein